MRGRYGLPPKPCSLRGFENFAITEDHSKYNQISLVKIAIYVGFCVYRRPYLIWSPVIIVGFCVYRRSYLIWSPVIAQTLGSRVCVVRWRVNFVPGTECCVHRPSRHSKQAQLLQYTVVARKLTDNVETFSSTNIDMIVVNTGVKM